MNHLRWVSVTLVKDTSGFSYTVNAMKNVFFFSGPLNSVILSVYKCPSLFSCIVSCFKRWIAAVHVFKWAKWELWKQFHRRLSTLLGGNKQEARSLLYIMPVVAEVKSIVRMKELSKYFLACKIVLDQTGTVWVQPLKVSSWLFISRQTINALDHLCIPCFPTLFCWALSLRSCWLGNRTGDRRGRNSVHSYTSADHPRESFRRRSDGWICSLLGKHKVKAQQKYCLMFS